MQENASTCPPVTSSCPLISTPWVAANAKLWLQVHFTLHGCHHKFPLDKGRLVFPPLPAAAVAAGLLAIIRALMPKVFLLES